MSNIDQDDDAVLTGFLAGYRAGAGDGDPVPVTVTYAVIGLTNFGERPVPSARLADVLGRPVREAEALARQWGWPGTQVKDGLVTLSPERARSATRRHIRIGDRRFGVTGCGCDIFFYAPLARPSLQVQETCPVTGTSIRLVFTPGGVEDVEPAGAVVAMMGPHECANGVEEAAGAGDIEDVDADVCAQMPLFASAGAAQGWLADHPGGRVFPVRGVGSEVPSRLAGPDAGPAGPRPLITGPGCGPIAPARCPGQSASAPGKPARRSDGPHMAIRNHPKGATG
jgi:alkylmercury lyase